MRLFHALFCGIMALGAVPASAGVIPDLYDTGVGNDGISLPDGTPDPHYTIVSGDDGSVASTTTVKTSASGYPVGWWTADSPNSAWIMPSAGYPGNSFPVGDSDFQTAFTLPNGVNSVTISLNMATDDFGPAVLFSGVQVAGPWTGHGFVYTPITFTSSNVQAGENTLTFVVYNEGGPTGLRVDGINGTFTTVPEPSSLLLALTLASLQLSRRRFPNRGGQ
ncbi:MAG: hypothetical protein ABSH20_01355 [Tepidisphaeraceae bacterium]|jgi:hypothetical protein